MTAAVMPRFLIRAGSAGDWMVWDRAARGPATLNSRKLHKLSREAAEAAYIHLLSTEDPSSTPAHAARHWQLLYGDEVLDCRDEHEAKILAPTLIKKGLRVSVRLSAGDVLLRTIAGRDEMREWLSK